jgi:hypothetical protein
MTKKKASRNIQKSTLDTMSITPPRVGGRTVPRGFLPYDGTKEEEIEALKLVFRLDGSNPYKDDAYNIRRFAPYTKYDETEYHTYLLALHSNEMEVVDKYAAIQDLIRHMFSTRYVWTPPASESGRRYMYGPVLLECLHRTETPLATRRRTGIETPPRELKYNTEEEEYNFDEVQEEPKQNVWISKTIKRAEERDQRKTAREKTKQRLTTATPPLRSKFETTTAVSTLFDSEEEESEEEEDITEEKTDETTEDDKNQMEVNVIEDKEQEVMKEDEAILRLTVQAQEYLQEQEETKSEVLRDDMEEDNNTKSSRVEANNSGRVEHMEEIMDRKFKVRFDTMELEWNRKHNISIERMEQSAKEQTRVAQGIIQEAESILTQLTTTLTVLTDRVEEANATILEVDNATTVIADYTEAAQTSKIEYIHIIETSRTAIGRTEENETETERYQRKASGRDPINHNGQHLRPSDKNGNRKSFR